MITARVHCKHLHFRFYFFNDFVHVCRVFFARFFLSDKMSVTAFFRTMIKYNEKTLYRTEIRSDGFGF